MVREDRGLPGGGVDVRVDLGREDGLVSQHFLHDAQVGPVLDEVRREGVTEGVRGDFLADAGEQRLLLDEVENGHPAQRAAVFVEESDVVEGRLGGLGADVEVGAERVGGHLAEGDEALFVAFADHAHEAFSEVDVRDEQAAGLGDAQAAAVEDFEDRAVAEVHPGCVSDGVENCGDLFDGKDFREVAAEFGGVDAVAGVVFALALEDQPVEEGFQRAEQPRLGALAELVAARKVPLDVLRPDRPRSQVQRLQQLRDVAPVGRHRVRRQPALHPQIVAVVLEDPVHAAGRALFLRGAGGVEAVAAEGLVNVFLAQEDEVVALAEAVRVVRERAAADADGVHLLHVLGDGHQARHGPEGLAEVVGVESGGDHAHAAVGQGLADFHEAFVEELRLVDADHFHVGADFFEHLGGGADGGGGDFMEVVRDDFDVGVAFVYDGLEDGDLLVGELGAAEAPDQLFGLAGEHRTAYDLDAAAFFVILGKH